MDDLEQKALMYVLAQELKKYHHERNVYRTVLQWMKDRGIRGLDALEESAFQSPEIRAETDHALAFLDQLLPPIPEVDLETAQRAWLEQWKPKDGEPH
ncbi:MAG: hypothetical protein WCC27_15630 [Acidobacteriaceae bacterium]